MGLRAIKIFSSSVQNGNRTIQFVLRARPHLQFTENYGWLYEAKRYWVTITCSTVTIWTGGPTFANYREYGYGIYTAATRWAVHSIMCPSLAHHGQYIFIFIYIPSLSLCAPIAMAEAREKSNRCFSHRHVICRETLDDCNYCSTKESRRSRLYGTRDRRDHR